MEFKNYKKYLYFIDFIGINPSLRILKYDNYKNTPSFIISIIILLIGIGFVIYSFIEYLNQTPDLIYYKSMDTNTHKKIFLADSFLMFQIWNPCFNLKKEDLNIYYYYSKEKQYSLDCEYCEIGKNIDYKFKNLIETFEKNELQNISEYFCIKFNNTALYNDISNNNISNLQISLTKEKTSNCNISSTMIYIITENDIINNNDKNNPIVPYYYYTYKLFLNNIINIYYNYQYIKFDSDEGIFFQNYKTYNAIGFSDLDYIYGNSYDSDFLFIGFIFNINKFNYDLYIRKYQKLQSLLADIMSIINLSVTIGKFIAQILLSLYNFNNQLFFIEENIILKIKIK